MVPERIAAILACPRCKSRTNIDARVVCPKCGSNYPIKKNIPFMHLMSSRKEIEKEISRAKSTRNLTNFSETISKEDNFLLSSQYNNPSEMRTLTPFIYKLGKKLYPPAPALNWVIRKKRGPLVNRFRDGLILNVGSGDNFIHENVINFDLDCLPGVNVVGNGECLPFLDETFNLIINQAVLEHAKRPSRIVKEMYRVLKRDGYVYVECPFLQEYHAYPLDFQRYTLSGLESLLSSFRKIDSGVCAGPSATFGRVFREYVASFSDNLYIHQILKMLAGWIIFPIRYLDLYLNKKKYAHVIAMGFYYIGQKI